MIAKAENVTSTRKSERLGNDISVAFSGQFTRASKNIQTFRMMDFELDFIG